MNIEIIAGSPRKPSLSLRLATLLEQYLLSNHPEHACGLINLQSVVLPFIQDVWTRPEDAPPSLRGIAERMFAADGFIICSPEYNGSYSPAMKNLFDHFPKQKHKPFGIATSSDGRLGGMRAAQQLLQLVPALFGYASPFMLLVPEIDKKIAEGGRLTDPLLETQVKDFVTEFLWLAERVVRRRS